MFLLMVFAPNVGLPKSALFTISVAQDQTFDYNPAVVGTWLGIGAAKINEWLGQRFLVPLTVWSDTVVWANCELAYIGMTRQRGQTPASPRPLSASPLESLASPVPWP